MKVCSICKRQYANSLKFCLDDGTVLTDAPDIDATLVDPQATLRLNVRETDARSIAPNHTKPLPWIAVAAVSIVVVFAVVGVAALLLISSATKSANGSSSPPISTTSPNSPQSSAPGAADEVMRANDAVGDALLHRDTDALARLLADDYRYVSDVGLTLNKIEIITLMRTGNLSYDVLTTSDSKADVGSSAEKAEVNGTARARGQLRRQPFTDSYFYRNTFEKRAGRWQLVSGTVWHRQ